MVSAVADLSQHATNYRPGRARSSVCSEERRCRPTASLGLSSLVFGLWSLVFGLWSLVFGLWSLIFGLWLCPIHQRTISTGLSGFSHPRRLDAVGAENVEHALPCRDQVVCDDAPVAAPPHRLGAHDRATPFMSQCAQMREAASERWGQRIVGKVVKALVLPERIDVGRNILPGAQAAQRRHVLVSDCRWRERFGKDVAIVLRVRARARNAAHVDQERDLRSFEQIDEFGHRPG